MKFNTIEIIESTCKKHNKPLDSEEQYALFGNATLDLSSFA